MAEVMEKGELRQVFDKNGAFAPFAGKPIPVPQWDDGRGPGHNENDEKDPVKAVHDKAREFDKLRQNLTKRGIADDAGVQKVNTRDGDEHESVKDKENKKAKMHHMLQKALDDYLKAVDEALEAIDKKIDATQELYEAYKKSGGKLDYTDPAILQLLADSGLSQKDIENNGDQAFVDYVEDLKSQREDLIEGKNQRIEQYTNATGDHSYDDRKIEEAESTMRSRNTVNAEIYSAKSEDAEEVMDALSYSEGEKERQQELSSVDASNLDDLFSNGSSVAKTVSPDKNINAENIKSAFEKATDPDQHIAAADTKPPTDPPIKPPDLT